MNDRDATVQLFVTCIIDTLYPEIGEAVVRVLERAGARVAFPEDQTCCGQPAFNAGLWPEARALAEHIIQVFEKTSGPIVVPSGSCAAMLRHHYQELFADDAFWLPRVQKLAARTFEFTEYLVDQLGIINVGAQFNGLLTYHSSCHLLRRLGVDRQPRALLAQVQGAQVVELPGSQECCGFGGVFSLEHPELSAAMLDRKTAQIEATQAPVVVACDAGCLVHINDGLHRQGKKQRALHIAQILVGRDQGFEGSGVQGTKTGVRGAKGSRG